MSDGLSGRDPLLTEEEINEYTRIYHSTSFSFSRELPQQVYSIESNHFGSGGIHFSNFDFESFAALVPIQGTRKTDDLLDYLDKFEEERTKAMNLMHTEQENMRQLNKKLKNDKVEEEISEEKIMNNKIAEVYTLIQHITMSYKEVYEKYKPIIKICEEKQTNLKEIYEQKKRMEIFTTNIPEYIAKISEIINKEISDREIEIELLKTQVSEFIDKSSYMINTITNFKVFSQVEENTCSICFDKKKNLFFQCGHLTCESCGNAVKKCPMCKVDITSRHKLYL